MVNAGVVPLDLAEDVEDVVAGVRAIRDADDVAWTEQGSNWLHTPEALATDPMWQQVRRSAQKALDGFAEHGFPIPSLSDPDFNTPREDAPEVLPCPRAGGRGHLGYLRAVARNGAWGVQQRSIDS